MTPIRVGILAGEASGDNLGAGLMRALRRAHTAPIEFVGVGGDAMRAETLIELASIEELSVNGFKDPIVNAPRLWRLLKRLEQEFVQRQVDVFVGVDFNVFNFMLEGRLKRAGVKTAHYVSPSVYAWRRGRTKRVAKVTDAVLCLFPFEPDFYRNLDVNAVFVGHPLADEISFDAGDATSKRRARTQLGLSEESTVLAVLPGSRRAEVKMQLSNFLHAAAQLRTRVGHLEIVIPVPRADLVPVVIDGLAEHANLDVKVVEERARNSLVACDIALVKSGTSTLEALLLHRPMVVSYRIGKWSYQLAKRLVRSPFIALPNILAGRELVPELLQYEATPEALAEALSRELVRSREDAAFFQPFEKIHGELRREADATAADAVIRLLRVGTN